ncbi:thiosulfate sulfurtransferase-like isoform X2 [Mercenaria mercenaria]|uniref:thiosulfate sulfurtransferase-like isoform X2 n=1 Tax=Mercenaria mercenaria TaxID=6596 RepID=UPI00234F0671|nr:thiosulfate sulfurtransferase-like isoform X2 [Mercenaria mercenaria]
MDIFSVVSLFLYIFSKRSPIRGHIPQAIYFDLFKCVNGTEEIPKELPELKCITDYIRGLGVWPDTHVIVYTRSSVTQAFRTWWTFRIFGHKNVSVLDGGFQKWIADGFNTSTSIPLVDRSTFEGKLNSSYLRNYDDMMENLQTKREQVVDSRAPDEKWVSGKEYDSGMIPGSKMVSYTTLFNTDGTMKNKLELKEIFEKNGVDLALPIVTYCNTGMKSTVVVAAAYVLGLEVSMYYGSWNEWRRRAPEELKHRVWEKGFP